MSSENSLEAFEAEVIRREHLNERKYFVRVKYQNGKAPKYFIESLKAIGFLPQGRTTETVSIYRTNSLFVIDFTKPGTAAEGDWSTEEQKSYMDKLEQLFLAHDIPWIPRRWKETDLP